MGCKKTCSGSETVVEQGTSCESLFVLPRAH